MAMTSGWPARLIASSSASRRAALECRFDARDGQRRGGGHRRRGRVGARGRLRGDAADAPGNAVMRSPVCRPARAAALPASTPALPRHRRSAARAATGRARRRWLRNVSRMQRRPPCRHRPVPAACRAIAASAARAVPSRRTTRSCTVVPAHGGRSRVPNRRPTGCPHCRPRRSHRRRAAAMRHRSCPAVPAAPLFLLFQLLLLILHPPSALTPTSAPATALRSRR